MPQTRKRRWWVIPAIIAAVAVLATTVVLFLVLRGSNFTIRGTLVLTDDDGPWFGSSSCSGSGGFGDVHGGAQLVVSDDGGTTVALGQLNGGQATSRSTCEFAFAIDGVPSGHRFYGIELTHRGIVRYTEEQVRQPLQLTLGR